MSVSRLGGTSVTIDPLAKVPPLDPAVPTEELPLPARSGTMKLSGAVSVLNIDDKDVAIEPIEDSPAINPTALVIPDIKFS